MNGYIWGRPVHNHGPAEGRGLDCAERTAVDGAPLGACYPTVEDARADAEARS